MSSQVDGATETQAGSTTYGSTAEGVEAGDNCRQICVVCQNPVDPDTSRLWRGEPIHFECGAELRCGITL